MTAVAALCGETPLGIAGALLQWLTLAILVVLGIPDIPLSWRLAVASIGVATLLAGVVFALRGGSLGPLIVIPGIIGVAMVVLLTIVFCPFQNQFHAICLSTLEVIVNILRRSPRRE